MIGRAMQVFGKYRVLERIAQGGMGTLLKAHDSVLDRTVALKLLGTHGGATDDLRARFFREARAGARLSHPNVVTVHDLGEAEGQLFIVMEFLEGEDLGRLIAERRRISLDARVGMMIQVCEGLGYAHRNGVVHRDLKPANVFVCRGGQVKILDFGIARLTRDDTALTATGVMLGTLRYMAPEQARGQADERSDVFSMGAVFHELLTFQPAFPGRDGMEILEALRAHEPPPVDRLDPTIPPDLARLVAEMLSKEPAGRPGSVDHIRTRLAEIQRRPTAAERPGRSADDTEPLVRGAREQPRRPGRLPQARRSRRIVWAVGSAALLSVVISAYALWPRESGSRESVMSATTPAAPALPPPAPPPPATPRAASTVAPVAPDRTPERPRVDPEPRRRSEPEPPRSSAPPVVSPPIAPRPVAPPVAPRPADQVPRAPSIVSPPARQVSPPPPTVPRPVTPVPAAPSVVPVPPALEVPETAPGRGDRTEPDRPSSAADRGPAPRQAVVAATPPDPAPSSPEPPRVAEPALDPALAAVAGSWKGLMSTRLSEAAVELSVSHDVAGVTAALLIHSARNLGAGTIGFHESYAIARHAWPKPLSGLAVQGRRVHGQDADRLFALDLELSRDHKSLEGTLTAEGTVYSVYLRRR